MKPLKKLLKYTIILFAGLIVFAVVLAIAGYHYFSSDLPDVASLKQYKPLLVTEVYSSDDVKIGEFFNEKRFVTPLNDIPKLFIQAFIAIEDARFYDHKGLDYQGIIRAFFADLRAGHFAQGGSTITQQVARSFLLTNERKISRKIKEAILSLRIEENLSKEEILNLYLNQIYLGQGAYGVAAAATNYFHKTIAELTLPEMAFIGGMPKAPSKYSPFSNPKKAKQRQILVLKSMYDSHFIAKAQYEQAVKEPLKVYRTEDLNLKYSPYFVEMVRQYLTKQFGTDAILKEGMKVYTTLKSSAQKAANAAIKTGLHQLDKRQGYRGPIRTIDLKEIEAFEKESNLKIIQKSKPYTVLYAPTTIMEIDIDFENDDDEEESYKSTTPIEVGEIYEGVVIEVDDKDKLIHVKLGYKEGIIPFAYSSWARKVNLEKYYEYDLIKKPSDALKPGDVILTKVIAQEFKDPENKRVRAIPGKYLLSLEQTPLVQGSLLSYSLPEGYIISMVGGLDYEKSVFNRAMQATRQAGSTFKPIIYSAAIDKGFTPASIIVDAPIVHENNDEKNSVWKPGNFGEKYGGDTTLRSALIRSQNTIAIKLLDEIKVPYVVKYARQLGVTSKLNEDLTLALGSSSVTLHEMTKVFGVFANGGRRIIPNFILKIVDKNGTVLLDLAQTQGIDQIAQLYGDTSGKEAITPPEEIRPLTPEQLKQQELPKFDDPNQLISPQTAYIMTYLMKEAVSYGTGTVVNSLKRVTAGKTGTTNDYTDALFIGYTPSVLTGVWTGFDQAKSLGYNETGGRAAAPIWLDYMNYAIIGTKDGDFPVPPGIVFSHVDNKTGHLALKGVRGKTFYAPFKEGSEPKPATTENSDILKKKFYQDDF